MFMKNLSTFSRKIFSLDCYSRVEKCHQKLYRRKLCSLNCFYVSIIKLLFAHYSCLIALASETSINEAVFKVNDVFCSLSVNMLMLHFLSVFLVCLNCLFANPTGKKATWLSRSVLKFTFSSPCRLVVRFFSRFSSRLRWRS